MQEPSVGGRRCVGLLDRHEPRLEVERRRDAVERLQPLARDGVDVAVQVYEARSDHEAGHVDDGRPLGREGRSDSNHRAAVHRHVGYSVGPGARVDHAPAAENQHTHSKHPPRGSLTVESHKLG